MPLGKSLGNILGDYFGDEAVSLATPISQIASPVNFIAVSQIQFNPYQTRTQFDAKKIESLAENIREHGLIHPISVISQEDGTYILLAGERRLRAIKQLGQSEILAIVRDKDSLSLQQQAMLSAMENLQREDLNAIELAQTFEMLMNTQNIDELKLSQILETSVQYVRNYLRLLTLSQPVQQALIAKTIGEGQARHLVSLDQEQQTKVLKVILEKDLTVKEIVAYLKQLETNKPSLSTSSKFHNLEAEIVTKAQKLAESFPNSKLKLQGDNNKGKIIISWGGKLD